MNKKIVQAVLERSEGLCEVQGCYAPGTELHHLVFGNGCRKQCETVESVKLLCTQCHRGTNGVHGMNGRELDLRLKRELQEKYFNKGYEEEKVRRLMGGKIY